MLQFVTFARVYCEKIIYAKIKREIEGRKLVQIENLEQIRQAIEVEQKNLYIDIRGKSTTFSGFVLKLLTKLYKKSKRDPKWLVLSKEFETYAISSVPARRKAVQRLVYTIRKEMEAPKSEKPEFSQNPADVDVVYVKGVGPKVANLLNKLGIFTAKDLIFYFPKRHIDYSSRTLIKSLKEGQDCTIIGEIKNIKAYNTPKGLGIVTLTVSDGTGLVKLNFFYAKASKFLLERYKSQFVKGSSIIISGKAKIDKFSGIFTIDKPEYQVLSGDFDEKSSLNLGRIVPVYQLVEGLNIKFLRRAIFNALEKYLNTLPEVIPDEIRKRNNLLDRRVALRQIHFPETEEMLERARFTIVFEEFFLLQLKLATIREENAKRIKTIPLKIKKNGLVRKFIDGLPFELTSAQDKALKEILKDIASDMPMQRLLQGDVGSGKTVVACAMLLSAVENGYQGVLMAPTEILAQQHFNNFVKWLAPLGLSAGLFIGSNKSKVRKELETGLKNGQINIAIGTHALIQENVEFANLGAIVIDEQHRFGVKQRSKLLSKGKNPQMLTMTATPIPRTLALTTHGDLDFSIIDEMPKNRKPIKTALIKPGQRKQLYKLIADEVKNGHQAYIVYPLIDESETLSAKAATIEAQRLAEEVFPDLKIGLLHGKLSPAEKDEVMDDFKNGKYDILVSTTVVEVGVDVPNATVMAIENAERFGLSQLHQLRGRVGRSELQSYCVLIPQRADQTSLERLKVMEETNNGFVISEKDLQLRGPGEFLGTRQSGMLNFALADLVRDTKILEIARKEAFALVESQNSELTPQLKTEMEEKFKTDLNLLMID